MKHRLTTIRSVGRFSSVQPRRRIDGSAIAAGVLLLVLILLTLGAL
jgi:hypothetical protein